MRRRDRQNEMLVALIVIIAMAFALIFSIILSISNDDKEPTQEVVGQPSATSTQETLPVTAESTPEEPTFIGVLPTEETLPTDEASPEIVSTETPTPTVETLLATATPEPDSSATETIEASLTATLTPIPLEDIQTLVAQNKPSHTPSPTDTSTATLPPTLTPIPLEDIQTLVAQNKPSHTPSPTDTPTSTYTFTATSTDTASWTPTATFTASYTVTPSITPSLTQTFTPSPMPTLTTVAIVASQTPSLTAIPLEVIRTQVAVGSGTPLLPTPTPCLARTDWAIYNVDIGDTAFRIAQRYGITVDALAAANCLTDPSVIYAGQPLRVPPGGNLNPRPDAALEKCNTPDAVITSPTAGATLDGTVTLKGVAKGANFRRYILDWRPDDPVLDYQSFAEVFEAVPTDGVLGEFPSDAFPPGLYWFRLRVLETNDYLIGECAIRVRFR